MIFASELAVKRIIELAKMMLSQIGTFITTSVSELTKVAVSSYISPIVKSQYEPTALNANALALGKTEIYLGQSGAQYPSADWSVVYGNAWVEESLAPIKCSVALSDTFQDTTYCHLYVQNGTGYIDSICTISFRSTAGIDYSYTLPLGICQLCLGPVAHYYDTGYAIFNKVHEHVRFEFVVPFCYKNRDNTAKQFVYGYSTEATYIG